MPSRPRSIAIIGIVYVIVGCGGLVAGPWRHFFPSGTSGGPASDTHALIDVGFVMLSGAIAVAGGVLVMRGRAIGRWLLAFWAAAHVVLGFERGWAALAVHIVVFVVTLALLYSKPATAYFTRTA